MHDTQRYAVAVRRDRRTELPADWLQQLADCAGSPVQGASEWRAVVALSPQGLARLQDRLGPWLHIEPLLPHGFRPPLPPGKR